VDQTLMGPEWYGRKVGVRVTILGEPGTRAFFAREVLPRRITQQEAERLQEIRFPRRLKPRTGAYDQADRERTEIPILPEDGDGPADPQKTPEPKGFHPVGEPAGGLPETGGVVIIAERRAACTMFTALHEPFEHGAWHIGEFRRIQETPDAVAVAIRGSRKATRHAERTPSAVDDRVMVRMGPRAGEPITLTDGEEQFTFTGFAYVRIAADAVTVVGDLAAMKLKVRGAPRLLVNEQQTKAEVRDGRLVFGP
jgi:hypothetical protein